MALKPFKKNEFVIVYRGKQIINSNKKYFKLNLGELIPKKEAEEREKLREGTKEGCFSFFFTFGSKKLW